MGFLSSLPYLGRFVGAQIFGLISSFIRRRNALSPLALQKLNAVISFVGPAAGIWPAWPGRDNVSACSQAWSGCPTRPPVLTCAQQSCPLHTLSMEQSIRATPITPWQSHPIGRRTVHTPIIIKQCIEILSELAQWWDSPMVSEQLLVLLYL